ncbi:MAG: hypothetical protein LC122_13055 [Chitinophagales bacterium]|nr:hypothetical protein [Chitinophagales bacterium]
MCEWKNTDPRHDIWKRAYIIILMPSLNGHYEAVMAYVDSKETYTIFLRSNSRDLETIDEWENDWKWIMSPNQ